MFLTIVNKFINVIKGNVLKIKEIKMKQKLDTLEQFCAYLNNNYSQHEQTFNLIVRELQKFDGYKNLVDQKFTDDDIAFAIKRHIALEHHYCPICGNEIHVYGRQRYPKTCSVSCGVQNSQELRKQKSLERYGVERPQQTQKCKDNYKKTMIERYGGYTYQSEELLQKVSKTNMERYGVEVSGSNKELHKKNVETCLKRYGVEHTSKLKENRDKAKKTNLIRYGSENYNNKEQYKKTCLERYGVENATQCHRIRVKEQSRYIYNRINFDSSWEIAYYIWLTDNNIQFEYQPTKQLKYTYKNKTHVYCPDFEVNGTLVEIKGSQYFNETKTKMICPYNHKLDGLYNAKYKCMLENNVQILSNEDIQQYLVYINQKYGIMYL